MTPERCAAVWATYPLVVQRCKGYLKYSNQPWDAEDLAMEVMYKALQALPTFVERDETSLHNWVMRIAKRVSIDYGRRKYVSTVVLKYDAIHSPDTLDIVILREHYETLLKALGRMTSESQKKVLLARFFAGLSLSETAMLVDKDVINVKALQWRGLRAMRKILTKMSGHGKK